MRKPAPVKVKKTVARKRQTRGRATPKKQPKKRAPPRKRVKKKLPRRNKLGQYAPKRGKKSARPSIRRVQGKGGRFLRVSKVNVEDVGEPSKYQRANEKRTRYWIRIAKPSALTESSVTRIVENLYALAGNDQERKNHFIRGANYRVAGHASYSNPDGQHLNGPRFCFGTFNDSLIASEAECASLCRSLVLDQFAQNGHSDLPGKEYRLYRMAINSISISIVWRNFPKGATNESAKAS